jgi:molecular chaperone HscB
MDDYFAVFGLPRKLRLDAGALQRAFYALSREHHPDFHQGAAPGTRAAALARSALVNRAYRALRDPLARVEYLVALEEGGPEAADGAGARRQAPVDLLEEMLEVQEALEEARASGLDPAAVERLRAERARLEDRRQTEARALLARFADWDDALERGADRRPLLQWFRERLAVRAYLGTVIGDLSEALGDREEDDVTHRRH